MPVVPYSASSSGGSQDPNVDTSKFTPYSGTVSIPDASAKTSVDSPAPAATDTPNYGVRNYWRTVSKYGYDSPEAKAVYEEYSKPTALNALSTGAGTALVEPVLGVTQMAPGVLGDYATEANRNLQRDWQQTVEESPIAARLGYWPTELAMGVAASELLGAMGVAAAPEVLGAPELLGAGETLAGGGKLTKWAMKGPATGAVLGLTQPVDPSNPNSWGMFGDKAFNVGVGGTLGTILPTSASLLWSGGKWLGKAIPAAYRAVTGEGAEKSIEALTQKIKSGDYADILSGKAGATVDRIRMLQGTRQISREQADQAIEALNSSEARISAGVQTQVDNATHDVGEVLTTIDAAPTKEQVGQNIQNRIKSWYNGVRGNRASVADAMYEEADASMQSKFDAGQPWQTFESGARFINKIRNLLSTSESTQISTQERNLIENFLLPNLEGTRVPGQAGGLAEVEGGLAITPGTESRIAFSRPKVIREALRKLRDAANGHPEEGYPAIAQQRAGELAKELAQALSEWDPLLSKADAKYQEMSELFEPARTALGSKALRGEKFNAEQPAMDPSKVPDLFFKTPQTVRQLVALSGGDTKAVENEAANYAFRQLSGYLKEQKDPAAARKWLQNNSEWLNPETLPNAYNRVLKQAKQLEDAGTMLKNAEVGAKTRAEALAEQTGDIRTEAEKLAATTRTLEGKAATEEQNFRKPFDDLAKSLKAGAPAKDLPNQVRSLLNNRAKDIPEDVLKEWHAELNRIDGLKSDEEKAKAIYKFLAVAAAGAVGFEGAKGVLSILGTP